MSIHKNVFNESRKIYKKGKAKAVTIGLVSFFVKFVVYFAIMTAQFLCAQFWGKEFIFGTPAMIFYLLYIAAFVFVHIPISTGAGVCYAKIAMRHKVKVDDVFAYFKQMKKAIRCRLPVAIKIALATGAWYVTGKVASSILVVGGFAAGSAVWIFTITTIVLLAIISDIAIVISNSAITYVLAKVPDISARKTVRTAKNAIRYHGVDMFALYLRAVPQLLLCVVTLGIGFIWIGPFLNILNKRFIRYFCD